MYTFTRFSFIFSVSCFVLSLIHSEFLSSKLPFLSVTSINFIKIVLSLLSFFVSCICLYAVYCDAR